jgi:hypothetical protein
VRNDIPGNTFHLHASPFARNVNGFAASIGGHGLHGNASHAPTAEPLWVRLRAAGKRVVAATWPGADGVDVRIPGLAGSPIVDPAARRRVDYTVPYGAFAGAVARGHVLDASSFSAAPATTVAQLAAARRGFVGSVRQTTTPIETLNVGGRSFALMAAALDTIDDGRVEYDTLVFFDRDIGIAPGPFAPPSTGPAYVRVADKRSATFYFEGSSNKAGTAFYVSALAPDLSHARIVRHAASFIPRNASVLADVDDVNASVGFWPPQPDSRIVQRGSPSFAGFPDAELEEVYLDQLQSFVDYQVRVILHSIDRVPGADLVMGYIEQPDGAGHQFLMTDPRQASDPGDAGSIGGKQEAAKRARYLQYVRIAYRTANEAVQRIVDRIGVEGSGRPRSNVIVVSDHGMAPFHTAVDLHAYLASRGFDAKKVRAVTSGPAANIYINLEGRNHDGTVIPAEFAELQAAIADAMHDLVDRNPAYVTERDRVSVFEQIHRRPLPADPADPRFGLGTSDVIGQDSGDVYAVLGLGYNFGATQSPAVPRMGDTAADARVFSVPAFYGAHGHDPAHAQMSAIFYAAGPDVCNGRLAVMRNIDIAPTILALLGVEPAPTVEGAPHRLCTSR